MIERGQAPLPDLFYCFFLKDLRKTELEIKEQVRKRGLPPLLRARFFLTIPPIGAYASSRMSRSLNRHYYYYGPLSSGRDGLAMGCRRAMQ
jgi:hypothetical protein